MASQKDPQKTEMNNRQKQNESIDSQMNQFVNFFDTLSGQRKLQMLRMMGVNAIHHVNRDQGSGQIKDVVFPSNIGVFGRALPSISRFIDTYTKTMTNLSSGRLEIDTPELITALSNQTYFRKLDDDKQPVGDQPGLIEELIIKLNEQRGALTHATSEAWDLPPRAPRKGGNGRNSNTKAKAGKSSPVYKKEAQTAKEAQKTAASNTKAITKTLENKPKSREKPAATEASAKSNEAVLETV